MDKYYFEANAIMGVIIFNSKVYCYKLGNILNKYISPTVTFGGTYE